MTALVRLGRSSGVRTVVLTLLGPVLGAAYLYVQGWARDVDLYRHDHGHEYPLPLTAEGGLSPSHPQLVKRLEACEAAVESITTSGEFRHEWSTAQLVVAFRKNVRLQASDNERRRSHKMDSANRAAARYDALIAEQKRSGVIDPAHAARIALRSRL